MKRIAKAISGKDYLVVVSGEGNNMMVSSESYLKKNPRHKGTNIGAFLAHCPYWTDL